MDASPQCGWYVIKTSTERSLNPRNERLIFILSREENTTVAETVFAMAYFTSVPPSALSCFSSDALKSSLGRLMPSVMLRILVIDRSSSFAHIVTDTEIKKRVARRRFSRLEARTQARGKLKIVSINV